MLTSYPLLAIFVDFADKLYKCVNIDIMLLDVLVN